MKHRSEIKWLEKLMNAKFRAAKEAVEKVATQNAANDAKQNEWRQAMKDREGKYMTRAEFWVGMIAVVGLLVAVYFK